MRDIRLYLQDIIEAIDKIEIYIDNCMFEDFEKDNKTIDAVIRNIELIGEAVRQIPEEIKEKYPLVEWKEAICIRNIVAHEYFGIDLKIIWETIKQDLPKFKKEIDKVFKDNKFF